MTPLRSKLLSRPSTFLSPSHYHRISSLVLQLPPSYRTFHASPQAQFLDVPLILSHDLLQALHTTTGLPWAYTLPLSALLIRGTIILPLSIYVRRMNRTQTSLFPLIQSWRHALRKETMREVGHLGPSVAQNTLMKKVRKKRKEVYKRWGVQMWKTTLLPLLQLPVFLVVIEAIRKMCGEKQGLFGMFTNTVSGWFRAGEVDTTLPASLDAVEKIPIEASFATEGMLWFPNLLLPDPNLGLPFILSGVILINIFSKGPIVAGATDGRNRWQKRFQRSMGVFALAIGPLTFNIPSAMLIYWISSSTFAYGQSVLLDKFMPIKKPVHACKPKRPLTFGVGVPQEGEKL